jgi:hypothetical protein
MKVLFGSKCNFNLNKTNVFVMELCSNVILYLHMFHSEKSSTQNSIAGNAGWEFSFNDNVCAET